MEKKMCKLFYCDRKREHRCCATCFDFNSCRNHCLNGPERCGQSEEPKPKKKGGAYGGK